MDHTTRLRAICLLLLAVNNAINLSSAHDSSSDQHDAAMACSPESQPLLLTDPSGTFTSQNYPEGYLPDSYCHWVIVAQPNQIIQLNFDAFATERSYDRVWVYDGYNASYPIVIGFDGERSPPPTNIFSSQGIMSVVFTTDVDNALSGFSATYTSVNPVGIEDACAKLFRPLVMTNGSGVITSQYHPAPYPLGSNCQWLISTVETNGTVKLDFDSFLTEPNADFVMIYDGIDATTGTFMARLSGALTPAPVGFQTQSQNMFITHVADNAVSVRGFSATFTLMPPPA